MKRTKELAGYRLACYNLASSGVVGPLTWNRLFREYLDLQPGGPSTPPQPQIPPYPGSPIRQGATGENVRLIQNAVNRLAPCQPRLWRLNEDGNFGPITRDAIFTFQNVYGLAIKARDIIEPTPSWAYGKELIQTVRAYPHIKQGYLRDI
jgi:peptidoglycan hydrolase-like protein with peptidoglycan-binding domain